MAGRIARRLEPRRSDIDKEPGMELIDRIRKDIQERLDAVLGEADKLRKALTALDPRGDGSRPARPASNANANATTPSPAPAQSRSRRRTPPGATKRRVLDALSDGKAKTAGEVAAETGVARGTVSTTLSKLAKTGEVVKAERGYRLPGARTSAAASGSSSAA
jgi:DNA-binding transcriptional ArsR family regulator